jgi:RNA 2',3'-cyclic 3'-phosphodiesterase
VTPAVEVRPVPWRVFVALRVPGAVAEPLASVARTVLGPGVSVRWVDPADLHLTLWFIGPLLPAELPAVMARLAAAAAAARPIECRVQGTGTFGRGRGRTAWAGLAEPGATEAADLAAQLGPPDAPHQAHVTICRGAPPGFAADLGAALAGHAGLMWRATSLELLRSHPGRRPAYETIAAVPLGGVAGA